MEKSKIIIYLSVAVLIIGIIIKALLGDGSSAGAHRYSLHENTVKTIIGYAVCMAGIMMVCFRAYPKLVFGVIFALFYVLPLLALYNIRGESGLIFYLPMLLSPIVFIFLFGGTPFFVFDKNHAVYLFMLNIILVFIVVKSLLFSAKSGFDPGMLLILVLVATLPMLYKLYDVFVTTAYAVVCVITFAVFLG